MITVACVYKTGGDFDAEYVRRLGESVHRHVDRPHDFVCLTDDIEGVSALDVKGTVIPLRNGWPGWWSKMELFRIPPPAVYFDLDVVIVNKFDALLDAVALQDAPFMMLRSFRNRPDNNSSVMAWTCNMRAMTIEFERTIADGKIVRLRNNTPSLFVHGHRFHGDQDWIQDYCEKHCLSTALVQDIQPGVYSYKRHIRPRNNILPGNTSIVCFHGKPRPPRVRLVRSQTLMEEVNAAQ